MLILTILFLQMLLINTIVYKFGSKIQMSCPLYYFDSNSDIPIIIFLIITILDPTITPIQRRCNRMRFTTTITIPIIHNRSQIDT